MNTRLLHDETIERYCTREVLIEERMYTTFFRYTGRMALDSHEVEVGFTLNSKTWNGTVYLPSVDDNGLMARNRSRWYPVYLVLPPPAFRNHPMLPSGTGFLNGLLNDSPAAVSLADFCPTFTAAMPIQQSRLYTELRPKESQDINDTRNWIALDLGSALIELFNHKIVRDIARSLRPGFAGPNATVRSLHALLRAFTRYCVADPIEHGELPVYEDSELEHRGRLIAADRTGVLFLHPVIKTIALRPDTPIDFCSGSLNHPLITGRCKDGIHIRNFRFDGEPRFPYASTRRAVVGIMNDDPRRVFVAGGIRNSLSLKSPDMPLAETELEVGVDSLSLPGIRMTHPLTFEDGIIVSETFAEKASAFVRSFDRFSVPDGVEVWLVRKPNESGDVSVTNPVNPGDTIAVLWYRGDDGKTVVRTVSASVRTPSILTAVDHFTPASDLDRPGTVYRFSYRFELLLMVGDKLSDAHGNKGVVARILPDEKMPLWEGIRCHYIASPYIMKRGAVGAEIEDKLALIGHHLRSGGSTEVPYIDSREPIGLNEVDAELAAYGLACRGTVQFEGREYRNVPLSYRRMFRLNHSPLDAFRVYTARTVRSARLGVELLTLLGRNARSLVRSIIDEARCAEELKSTLIPVFHSLLGTLPDEAPRFAIRIKLAREVLGRPFIAGNAPSFEHTVCDPRIREAYGIIMAGGRRIIVPPHEPFVELGNGARMISRLSLEANRVIAETVSERSSGRANISRAAGQYREALASVLGGKDGLLARLIQPRIANAIRAVATPFLSDDPLCVALPRRAYAKLCGSDQRFVIQYGDRGKRLCLLKRDPVHRAHNCFAVRFTLWDNCTIGVSPALIGALDGDFDGDTVAALFPLGMESSEELTTLLPDFSAVYTPSRELRDVTPDDALRALADRTGLSSCFAEPNPYDRARDESLIRERMEGRDSATVQAEALAAALDFTVIKDGTARVGALLLRFLYSLPITDTECLNDSMELFHLCAQNTLDAKAGGPVVALEIAEAFNNGETDRLGDLLGSMGYRRKSGMEAFNQFARAVREAGSMRACLRANAPVLAVMQNGSTFEDALRLARLATTRTDLGEGLWERVLAHYLGIRPLRD